MLIFPGVCISGWLLTQKKISFTMRMGWCGASRASTMCAKQSKLLVLGLVIPPLRGNPYDGYINLNYWVDDHLLLYGNNGSLETSSSTSRGQPFFCTNSMLKVRMNRLLPVAFILRYLKHHFACFMVPNEISWNHNKCLNILNLLAPDVSLKFEGGWHQHGFSLK